MNRLLKAFAHKEASAYFVLYALFGAYIMCLLAAPARAEAPICILPANTDISGTPCTDAVSAYDGQNALIEFDSCPNGTIDVKIVFQQEPGAAKSILGFQGGLTYDNAILTDPVCSYDPQSYFADTIAVDCGEYSQTLNSYYIFGGEINLMSSSWPLNNPNFVLANISLNVNNLTSTNTLQLTNTGAKSTYALDLGNTKIQTALYGAHIVCGMIPTLVVTDNQDGDETARTSNTGIYNVDFTATPDASLTDIFLRACSTDANCGDIIDWTPLAQNINSGTYSTDWALPSAVWSALPNGTSYISVKASDSSGATVESAAVFSVFKQVAPMPPSKLIALQNGDGIDFSWTAPTQNTEGATLTDLASYMVYSLSECGDQTLYNLNTDPIPATATEYFLADKGILPYNFYVATALNADGIESARSNCVTVTTQNSRIITGSLLTYDTSNGTVSGAGYPDLGISGYTVILMDGDQQVGQAQTGADGSYIITIPQGATTTLSVRVTIPASSGYLYESGSLTGAEAWREIATVEVGAQDVAAVKDARMGIGPTAGDFNCNGVVDITDVVLLKPAYGSAQGEEKYNANMDINGDAVVDITDFVLLKKSFGLESETAKPELCSSP